MGVSLYEGVVMPGELGAFEVSGEEVAFIRSPAAPNTLGAAPGSYTITGNSSSLYTNRKLGAIAGSLTLTGFDALIYGTEKVILGSAGSYSITGEDTPLLWDRVFITEGGTLEITGVAAGFLYDRALNSIAGSYDITGNDAALLRGNSLGGEAGSYTITGNAASFLYDRIFVTEAGSISITGQDITLLRDYIMQAGFEDYFLSPEPITMRRDRIISADAGSYDITGHSVGMPHDRVVSSATGSYTLTGQAVNLMRSRIMGAAAGSYAITGQTTGLKMTFVLPAVKGTYTLTGQSATLKFNRKVGAVAGSYTLTGQSAALKFNRKVGATAGSYSITGNDVTMSVGGGSFVYGTNWVANTSQDIVSGQHKGAANNVQSWMDATAPIGTVLILQVSFDNVATTDGETNNCTGVTDSGSNTWIKVAEYTNDDGGAGTGIAMALFYSKLTTQMDSAVDSITVQFSTNITAKAWSCNMFTNEDDLAVEVTDYVVGGSTDTSTFGSMTLSGLPDSQYLFYRTASTDSTGFTFTPTSGWTQWEIRGTTGGADATNVVATAEFMSSDSATGATSNPSGPFGTHAGILAAFHLVPP